MFLFWEKIIKPIINLKEPKHIVEIGSATGENTNRILEYCKINGAKLSAIDPVPQFDVAKLQEKYAGLFDFYRDLSLNALPLITDYDVILIDGDHNWYTVYNELKIIEKTFVGKSFPAVFFHDTCWPYGRRDLYYAPDTIPDEYRHPYAQLGMIPGQSDLCKVGGINVGFNNAIDENTLKNGVYTAIEDFIKQSNQAFLIHTYNSHYGLTLLTSENDIKLYDCFKNLHSEILEISESISMGLALSRSVLIMENMEHIKLQEEMFNLIKKCENQISVLSARLLDKKP